MPHRPQFELSVAVFTHCVPHAVCPAGQVHVPAEQVWAAPHATPQPPQLLPSDCVLVQLAPQNCWPLPHWQEPAAHERPPVHAVPHCPQLELLVLVSTHCVPHRS